MVKMEILENDEHHIRNSTSSAEFSKKDGIKYCYICGKECFSDSIMCCGKSNFMSIKISEIVGGYVELAKKDKLKTYYNKGRYTKSSIKMNLKRMIHQLLMHKDNINISKESVDKIYNSNVL